MTSIRARIVACALVLCSSAAPAFAHHEAIFGPQSALVLSGDRYATAQVFTRRVGAGGATQQETTTVLGTGWTPRPGPFSVSVVLPFSVIAASGRRTQVGLENVVVAARYRIDLDLLERGEHVEEAYLLAVGGAEVPTGTIDYAFGKGAPALVSAATVSLERRPFSAIAYGVLHRYAERHDVRDSGNTFLGAGLAWTPVDDEPAGRLLSFQLSVAHERTSRQVVSGVPRADSGGWALTVHPTLVCAAGRRVLLFAQTSLPVAYRWNSADDRERLRIGGGMLVALGR